MSRWALALAAVLAAAACSASEEAKPVESPWIDQAEAEALDQRIWRRTEALTAECMVAHGFDYVPRDYPESRPVVVPTSPFAMTKDEAAERGFGIVDATVAAVEAGPQEPPDDPNAEVLDQLSGEHQGAWDAALHGGGENSGCRREAATQAREEFAEEAEQLAPRADERWQRILADPRYARLWEDWSGCMAEQGFIAEDIDALKGSIAEEAEEAATLRPSGSSDGEPGALVAHIDRAKVEEARAEEIAAASASVECSEPLAGDFEEVLEDANEGLE